MAVSLGEGLMAAATGFVEGFGGTVLKNIDESNKQDRAYVLQQAATMRDRITKGRAKEAKLKNTLRARYDQLGVLKGITDEERLAMITNEGIFAQVQKKISDDAALPEEKRGMWYKTRPESKNINPYAPRSEAERMGIDELMKKAFVPYTLPDADKDDEKSARDDILNAMFGGGQSPERLLAQAEKRAVSQRGLGTVSGSELDLYYARGGLAEDRVARGEMAPIAFQSTRVETPPNFAISATILRKTGQFNSFAEAPDVKGTIIKITKALAEKRGVDQNSEEYKNATQERDRLVRAHDLADARTLRTGRGSDPRAVEKFKAGLNPAQRLVLEVYLLGRTATIEDNKGVIQEGYLKRRLGDYLKTLQQQQ